jgi:LPXTG-motif cell wall-anchored protein
VVPGVGTYTVVNGVMTFTPEPNYVGTPPPVVYQVSDSMGGKASSTYTPTVIAPPTVRADTTTAGWDVPQIMNVVTSTSGANTTNTNTSSQDSAATGTTLKANSLTIDCASAADCTETIDGNGVVTAVTMTGQGTYTVTANNTITFDPVASFVGTARPVTYSISDELNQVSSTTYTPKVVVPLPVANPETKLATLVLVNPPTPVAPTDPNYQDYLDELNFGPMHWTKTFTSVLQGPGVLATGSGLKSGPTDGPCLIDPVTSICSTTVTIPGEGTYTMDQTTGVVTFVSEVVEYAPSGSNITPGPKTPVTYQVTDAVGNKVTSTLTPIIPPPPVANPDVSIGVQGVPQTLSPVGNDRPGGGASITLYPDTRLQTPSGIFLCAANEPPPDCTSSSVEVNDVINGKPVTLGVLTVTATGLVIFTPEPDFIGTTPPIGYQIPDNLGQKAYSTITITVLPPPAPSANIDTGSAEYNKPVTLKPWLNDSAGAVPAGSTLPAPNLIATSIRLCDDNETIVAMSQTVADCTAMKVTTIEGTYEVNPETGEVVFTPVDGFIGTVKFPPTYQIWTDWEGAGVKSAISLLIPTIAPPGAPAAEVDVTVTKPGTSVVLNPVENDTPGSAVLDPKTVRLCGADEIAPDCTKMSVTTLDGTYVVDPETGKVTFTPRDGFTGKATIPYIIHDAMGMVAASHLIITVEEVAVPVVAPAPQTPVVAPVVTPVVYKKQLPKTGGTRPDVLLLLGILAMVGAGGLRVASRKR